jgi:hypothetical protein
MTMDSAKLNDWMQVLGIFALVASLIFVGLQMQQSHQIASSQTQQARTDATVEMIVSSAENPYFVSALAKYQTGQPESVTPEEYAALSQMAVAILWQMENGHYQNARGFLTEGQWQRSVRTLEKMLAGTTPLPVRAAYESNPHTWTPEFGELVEELIREIDAESETH